MEFRMGRPMVAQLILEKMRHSSSAKRILCSSISSTRDFIICRSLNLDCAGALANAAANHRCFSMIISNLRRRIDTILKPPPKEILANALVAATYANHVEAVELLLKLDANPNHSTLFFGDAFSAAAALGYEEILKMYLARGVSEIQTPGEWTARMRALNKAARAGNNSIIQLLLDRKPDTLQAPFPYDDSIKLAVRSSNKSTVELLLKNCQLYGKGRLTAAANDAKFWLAAFRTAAQVGNEAVMRLLLQYGSVPHTDLEFVIEDACRHGSKPITGLLLHDPTGLSLAGARFWAARSGDYELIHQTLSEDTNPDICAYADALAGAFSARDESAINYILSLVKSHQTARRPETDQKLSFDDFDGIIRLLLSIIPPPETTESPQNKPGSGGNSVPELLRKAALFRNLRNVVELVTKCINQESEGDRSSYFGPAILEACLYNSPGISLFLGQHVKMPTGLGFAIKRTPILQQLLDSGWDINEPLKPQPTSPLLG
jgi:hypothetical protein